MGSMWPEGGQHPELRERNSLELLIEHGLRCEVWRLAAHKGQLQASRCGSVPGGVLAKCTFNL